MSQLWQSDRYAKLVLSNADEELEVEGLRIRFEIGKTLLGYPARGRIEVYNLGEPNIQKITQRYTTVELYCGYLDAGNVALVFRGNIINFFKTRFAENSVFTMVVKSSTTAWDDSYFAKTYRAGVAPETIITEVAQSFGGVIVRPIEAPESWVASLADVTLSGSSRQLMNQLSRTYNFDWDIMEGEVTVVPRGKALLDKAAYVITPLTGLIGAATITELGADFRMLLNPGIMLGRQVQLLTDSVQLGQANIDFRRVRNTADGLYKVMDIRLFGDTRGIDWFCDIVGWIAENEPRK